MLLLLRSSPLNRFSSERVKLAPYVIFTEILRSLNQNSDHLLLKY